MDSGSFRSLAVKYIPRVCLCLALAPSLIAIAVAWNAVPIAGDAPPAKQLAISEFARVGADDLHENRQF